MAKTDNKKGIGPASTGKGDDANKKNGQTGTGDAPGNGTGKAGAEDGLKDGNAGKVDGAGSASGNTGDDGAKTGSNPDKKPGKVDGGISKEDQEKAITHANRLRLYGAGYVVAKKGTNVTVFTAHTWKNLPPKKQGWVAATDAPPEAAALAAKK